MKVEWKTAFAYWYIHFAVEVICFYTLFRVFNGGPYWWSFAVLYDTLAFAPQAVFGAFCEKHPRFRPGLSGGIMLLIGSAVMLLAGGNINSQADALCLSLEIVGLIVLTFGNGLVHISGAHTTLRVSEGRLSESAIFVGGGSFGVITGRLLSGVNEVAWIPFVLMAAATVLMTVVDKDIRERFSYGGHNIPGEGKKVSGDTGSDSDAKFVSAFDFDINPCRHSIAAERPKSLMIIILALVVVVRAYIGYGLPTAWNQTVVQTIFLFCFMGIGKMSGGILSDLFGARRIGIFSCLLSIPLLLVSNNIMWLSLIAVALFSMTMAITLGGLVSIMPHNPGVAFGITTLGLLLGTLPTFFWGMPGRKICDILIIAMSVLAAGGLWYCIKGRTEHNRFFRQH